MSQGADHAVATTWNDPERCPFCSATLDDGGWGFIRHVRASSPCKNAFDDWRERVGGDIGGEWSG